MTSHALDAQSALVDALLGDLSVRSAMYVGRRAQDGDADTCVIQTGEEGRHRLALPKLDAAPSIERFASEAQTCLAHVLRAPVPRCPLHDHALAPHVIDGQFVWECPRGAWHCALGDYAELTWPQLDAFENLAPILARRLDRRGLSHRSVSVNRTKHGLLAEFGLPELSAELIDKIRDAAAPLPVSFYLDPRQPIRIAAA